MIFREIWRIKLMESSCYADTDSRIISILSKESDIAQEGGYRKMKLKMKKNFALFLAVLVAVLSVNVDTYAAAPRVAVQIDMSTNADLSGLVDADSTITATVTWKSILAFSGEPITLQVTNGAEILISAPEDVTFKADGVPASVGPVTRSADGNAVTFSSAPPAASPLDNEITFRIKAPSRAGKFNISAKIGKEETPNTPLINFVEKELTVIPTIDVVTNTDIIIRGDTLHVFGTVNAEDPLIVGLVIFNAQTGDVAFEATTTDISDSGEYDFGSFSFKEPYAENVGTYTLQVTLLDHNYNQIATAEKSFEYRDVNRHTVIIKYQVAPHSFELAGGGNGTGGVVLLRETEVREEGSVLTYYPKEFPGYQFTGWGFIHFIDDRVQTVTNGIPLSDILTKDVEFVFEYRKL